MTSLPHYFRNQAAAVKWKASWHRRREREKRWREISSEFEVQKKKKKKKATDIKTLLESDRTILFCLELWRSGSSVWPLTMTRRPSWGRRPRRECWNWRSRPPSQKWNTQSQAGNVKTSRKSRQGWEVFPYPLLLQLYCFCCPSPPHYPFPHPIFPSPLSPPPSSPSGRGKERGEGRGERGERREKGREGGEREEERPPLSLLPSFLSFLFSPLPFHTLTPGIWSSFIFLCSLIN